MQKKLIAIAVAAALAPAVAMADTNLYGRIHTSIDHISGSENSWSANSSSSRFGVKGSEDLGGGLTAIYQLESGIASVGAAGTAGGTLFTGQRDTWVGLTGSFGTSIVGRQGLANQWVYDSNMFGDQVGDAATFTNAGAPGRTNGVIAYVSPSTSGFTGVLAVVPAANVAGATTANTDTSWGGKIIYAAGGVGVNFTYFDVDVGAAELKPISLAGSFDFGQGMVSAQYVRGKVDTAGGSTTQNAWNLGGKFNMGNGALKAQYSKLNDASNTDNTGASMFAVGYDHSLTKRTGVYVAYAKVDNDSGASKAVNNWGHGSDAAGTGGEDPAGFSVGLTHNF